MGNLSEEEKQKRKDDFQRRFDLRVKDAMNAGFTKEQAEHLVILFGEIPFTKI